MRSRRLAMSTVKWGCLAATLAAIVVWLGSGWWYAWCIRPGAGVSIVHGGIALVDLRSEPGMAASWTFQRTPYFSLRPGFDWQFALVGNSLPFVRAPLWPLVVASAAASILVWRRDAAAKRRNRNTECSACGYDRSGLALRSRCPECGSAPDSATAHT